MAPTVLVERVEARSLAAVRRTSSNQTLGHDIIAGLDIVWPAVRAQGIPTGHNVVVYHGGVDDIEIGVEVTGDLVESGEVRRSETPTGEAARVTHWGDYAAMQPAYEALERWCQTSGRRTAGVSWEVYGHWTDNPAERRTDIFFLLEPD